MEEKKTALIVTDGAITTQKTAEAIESALDNFKVKIVAAGAFSGTHILPADVCFFGSEIPNPPSFAYLYTVLQHINLAGRPCGIFSASTEAIKYLCGMVHDSELALFPEPLPENGDAASWAKKVTGLLRKE